MAPNPLDQYSILGLGNLAPPLLHFPPIGHAPEGCGAVPALPGPAALGASMLVSGCSLRHPLLRPLSFSLRASVWRAGPVPGRLPLFSTAVQPELLFHLAGLLGSLCLGFFLLKWAQAWDPSHGDSVFAVWGVLRAGPGTLCAPGKCWELRSLLLHPEQASRISTPALGSC